MKFTVDFVTQISQIDEKHWQDTFASANPFIQYHYLLSLETSQCVSSVTGWQPMHVKVSLDGDPAEQQPVALMPLYLKSHSYGEYMFDWSWAEAYKNHGIDYYPKLISAVPFSPVSGTRLAVAKLYTNYRSEILHSITSALTALADKLSVSNIQCLFHQYSDREMFDTCNALILEEELETVSSSANNPVQWHTREDVQFHWFNKGYTSFDDFLTHLNSRKRKAIRKERLKVSNQGIHFEKVSGSELKPKHWQQFIKFYQMTYLKRSGHLGYLNLDCFQRWSAGLGKQLTLVLANKKQENIDGTTNNETIAAALFFHDQDNLYGRYWGCLEEYDFLHFEACYYQGIELAIEKGLSCFNAGAQGEHKVARGFEPVVTHGSYLFTSTVFQEAIVDFLARERRYNQAYRIDIGTKLPFKQIND
jgi:uncharacterized protein